MRTGGRTKLSREVVVMVSLLSRWGFALRGEGQLQLEEELRVPG